MVMFKSGGRVFLLLLSEALLSCLCGVVAAYARLGAEAGDLLQTASGWLKILSLAAVIQASFYVFDLYDLGMLRSRFVLCVKIFQAIGLSSVAMAVIYFAVPQFVPGRGVYVISLLLMLSLMVCWRLLAMWLIGHPSLAERVLILGTDRRAIELARETIERREQGYRVVGFVGDDRSLVGQSLINPRVIGVVSELSDLVRRHQVDRIVVAFGEQRGRLPVGPLLEMKLRDSVEIEQSASFYERLTGKISTDMLRPSWLIFTGRSHWIRIYRRFRDVIDVLLALIGMVISSPVLLATAVAIKLDSRGPVFYTQERVGERNRTFKIIKFRSMYGDAERNGPKWAAESDPRVTRVGRIIRKLRIDELPQFINVIRGEMSLIGPRPERPVFVEWLEKEIPYYSQRHLVKPGLTGWAQIHYHYGASLEDALEKLQYDLYYIKNQSPLLDAMTLFATARIVLFGRGAR